MPVAGGCIGRGDAASAPPQEGAQEQSTWGKLAGNTVSQWRTQQASTAAACKRLLDRSSSKMLPG